MPLQSSWYNVHIYRIIIYIFYNIISLSSIQSDQAVTKLFAVCWSTVFFFVDATPDMPFIDQFFLLLLHQKCSLLINIFFLFTLYQMCSLLINYLFFVATTPDMQFINHFFFVDDMLTAGTYKMYRLLVYSR